MLPLAKPIKEILFMISTYELHQRLVVIVVRF
jgi:hypothetical protein